MMRKPLLAAILCAPILAAAPAWAQTYHDNPTIVPGVVPLVNCSPSGNCAGPVSSSNPMPVSGSFSATLTGFAPASVGTPISATTGGVTGTLPAGTTIVAQNVGAFPAYCQLGSSATGITNSKQISASGGQWAIAPGAATQITCEGVGGTTTINTLGGSGLAVDTGGGTTGGGGGGGTSSNFASAFPSAGTAIGLSNGTNMEPWLLGSQTSANSGAVVIASDQAAVATKLASGAIASGALAAGSVSSGAAVSGAFVAGAIADLAHGQGTMAASVPVVIASNQSTLPANTAQVNGITTLTGAGATGTGSQRVTTAQDTTTIAGSAPGTAGTASAQVVTVQGVASMTPLLANPGTIATWGLAPVAAGSAPTNMQVGGLIYNSSPLTPTTGQSLALQGDANGYLKVNVAAGGGSGGTSATDNSAWTAGTTAQTPIGCEYTSGGATALTTGHVGTPGCTSARDQFVALFGNAGAIMDFAGQNASSPANSLLIGGQFNTTPTTITSGNVSPFQLDSAGNLLVNVKAGGGSGGTSSSFSATFPSTGTAAGAEYLSSAPTLTSGQMVALQVTSAGSLHATVDNSNANGSAVSASSSPVVIASDQAAVAVKAASASIASGAIASGALASGSISSGAFAAGSIASGAAVSGAFATGAIADLAHGQGAMAASVPVVIASNQSVIPTSLQASAAGGASTTGSIVPNNTTAVVIKASPGTLYGVQLSGLGSAPAYLKIYNATSATCGSGTPVKRLMIPAASTAANGGGSNISFGPQGIAFSTGITECVTTGIADTDTTAPAASTFLVNTDWE